MSFSAHLPGLLARLDRIEPIDREAAGWVRGHLAVLATHARANQDVSRLLGQLVVALDGLQQLEARPRGPRPDLTQEMAAEADRQHGSVRRAAQALGVSHQTLGRRLAG